MKRSLDWLLIQARANVHKAQMESSARLCLADAVALKDSGDYEHARQRAIKSLAYSVGIGSSIYREATK